MDCIYLDNNATTRPALEVIEAMAEALRQDWANPSSIHRPGQAARQKLELAREQVCKLIGCTDRELIFTSGGTESDNLAILGSLEAQPRRKVLVTSRIEHSAVREMAEVVAQRGAEVIQLPNDGNGLVDLNALADLLTKRCDDIALVSVMWVNNETGVIEPIERIGALCREKGVRFHSDATACAGKMPINVAQLPVDLLTFAAHKFHGPKGAGGLYVRRAIRVMPQAIGGHQERDRRGGTENIAAIIGMAAAARLVTAWLATDGRHTQEALRDRFERSILDRVEDAAVNGAAAPRLWNTSNVAFARLEAEAILLLLSERGVCASAGSACASGSLDPSPVLTAMGIPPYLAHGSVRFSLCRDTTAGEIERALEIIPAAVLKLRGSMSAV